MIDNNHQLIQNKAAHILAQNTVTWRKNLELQNYRKVYILHNNSKHTNKTYSAITKPGKATLLDLIKTNCNKS